MVKEGQRQTKTREFYDDDDDSYITKKQRYRRCESIFANQGLDIMAAVMLLIFTLVNLASAFAPHLQNVGIQRTNYVRSPSPLFMSAVAPSNMTAATVQLKGSRLQPKPLNHEDGPVRAIHSIEEFLDAVENTEANELVVVK
jgi:hypothetical protein